MCYTYCSEQGQAALSCLKTLLEDCQELKADAKFQMLGVIDQMGGCQNAPSSGLFLYLWFLISSFYTSKWKLDTNNT